MLCILFSISYLFNGIFHINFLRCWSYLFLWTCLQIKDRTAAGATKIKQNINSERRESIYYNIFFLSKMKYCIIQRMYAVRTQQNTAPSTTYTVYTIHTTHTANEWGQLIRRKKSDSQILWRYFFFPENHLGQHCQYQ